MISPGQIAFNAYVKSMKGRTFDGKPIPKWELLGSDVQKAWQMAAYRAIQNFLLNTQLRDKHFRDAREDAQTLADWYARQKALWEKL